MFYNSQEFYDELCTFMKQDFIFVRRAYFNPFLCPEVNLQIIKQIKLNCSKEFIFFLEYVKNYYRLNQYEVFLHRTLNYLKQKHEFILCFIITATALNTEEKEKIEKQIALKLQLFNVQFVYEVDSSIIAGVVIKVNNKSYDLSLLTMLNKLKSNVRRKIEVCHV